MSQLISKQEIEKEIARIDKNYFETGQTDDSGHSMFDDLTFREGIEFAESKIKDLMIEFAEWIEKNCYYNGSILTYYGEHYSGAQQLFEQFMEERNTNNK